MYILEWKSIKGYEELYEINTQGIIRSLHKRNYHQVISSRISRSGYYTVRLSKNGKTSTYSLHRLLALTFIGNPLNKPVVNHKNGNILDNSIGNLEFLTHAENIQHAYDNNLIKKENLSKAKKVIDTCSNIIYPSIAAAQKLTRYSYSHFKRLVHGLALNNTCFKLAG